MSRVSDDLLIIPKVCVKKLPLIKHNVYFAFTFEEIKYLLLKE